LSSINHYCESFLSFATIMAYTFPSRKNIPRALSAKPMVKIDWSSGRMEGAQIAESLKTLGQLEGLFEDGAAFRRMSPASVVYRVQRWSPVPEGSEGGLFWGTTIIEPGTVGREYFMTHGHFHAKRDRTEFYATVSGDGALLLMDENRETRMEKMTPGSLHHIPRATAHRVANTGKESLRFIACWPADAGYDYDSIRKLGFSARLLCVDGAPTLVRSAT
jgi:glucose-6-phosphate isomerase, archaeal